MSLHKVFVYGTLKSGEPNHHWITDTSKGFSRFIGVGKTMKKYPLIIATKYNIPFVLDAPGQGHNVIGEVYEIDEAMLQHLDILEDHPSFYIREIERIELCTENAEVECWIYLLKKFKPEVLEKKQFEVYSSCGSHGLVYAESDNEATLEDL
ncbi:putative gamma-glutamylcyclotransferase CG2811 isoform X2 [Zootermopsis nevadensis]|uniref:putative gamma-glutamylcyclotransferase CG2811 isoform X2 n=1 Tax=Zootermopsis nevadensis TaxID=136037 RepID=UPI000B8E63A6|nr:putative gamma-glutamylcyclotransferase CG2811 isoform X2 [Zootermopsis nevadensis]